MTSKQLTSFISDNENGNNDTNVIIISGTHNENNEEKPLLDNGKKSLKDSQIIGVVAICLILFSSVILYASAYAKITWIIVLSSVVLGLSILCLLNWCGIPIMSTLKSLTLKLRNIVIGIV